MYRAAHVNMAHRLCFTHTHGRGLGRKGTPWRSICTCPSGKPGAGSFEGASHSDGRARAARDPMLRTVLRGAELGQGFRGTALPSHVGIPMSFFFRVKGQVHYSEVSCGREGTSRLPGLPTPYAPYTPYAPAHTKAEARLEGQLPKR